MPLNWAWYEFGNISMNQSTFFRLSLSIFWRKRDIYERRNQNRRTKCGSCFFIRMLFQCTNKTRVFLMTFFPLPSFMNFKFGKLECVCDFTFLLYLVDEILQFSLCKQETNHINAQWSVIRYVDVCGIIAAGRCPLSIDCLFFVCTFFRWKSYNLKSFDRSYKLKLAFYRGDWDENGRKKNMEEKSHRERNRRLKHFPMNVGTLEN